MAVKRSRVLIVEDTATLAETYAAYLAHPDVQIEIAGTGRAALDSVEHTPPDVIVLDVNLPDMDGLDVLRSVKAKGLPTEVVVITGQASVRLAVEAMKHGAVDFVTKPFSPDRLRVTVRNAAERRRLANAIDEIREEYGRERFVSFIGRSLAMQSIYRILESAGPSNATVFVTGESGTGKELCAEALHKLSPRRTGPFVPINCAAIPRDLLESEIFGHVKGAFTGATADRKGAALQADGGTLFLDEVCEMDLALQAKMLRFLQMKSVQRLGEDVPRTTDVRIVCASNRNPLTEVAAGRFREDLFYRLHVVPIELPPMRDRDDDVLLIGRDFLHRFAAEDRKRFQDFSPEAQQMLMSYAWPGNVRQLQNIIRNIVVLHDGLTVEASMLPRELSLARGVAPAYADTGAGAARAQPQAGPVSASAAMTAPVAAAKLGAAAEVATEIRPLDTVIRQTIEAAIAQSGGSIPKAAAALQVSPSTIYRRLQAWEAGETL